MLIRLVHSDTDNEKFTKCIDLIKWFFYPEDILKRFFNNLFDEIELSKASTTDVEQKTKELLELSIRRTLKSNDYGYLVLDSELNRMCTLNFPYMERYHNMFLKRKHRMLYSDPQLKEKFIEDLFSLDGENATNISKNHGNFNHFINVIMCLARLIQYFSEEDKIDKLGFVPLLTPKCPVQNKHLVYDISCKGNMRIFKLMLAGFFHDLGKTIIDARHSIEGEIIILADQTSTSLYELNRVIEEYKSDELNIFSREESFNRDDLTLISKMLLYHDQFGTLGTGEDGYLRLVKIVDFIKMSSLNLIPDFKQKADQLIWSSCTLLDLWVLNVADILVSIADDNCTTTNKFGFQSLWCNHKLSFDKIDLFFESEDGANRIHDLKIASRLLYSHFYRDNKLKIHVSDNSKIMKEAVDYSRFHTTERLRRLLSSSLNMPLRRIKKSNSERVKKLADSIIDKIKYKQWAVTIERSLEVLGTAEEFKSKFSWIGKMDYSLGFFERIANDTLNLIEEELTDFIEFYYINDDNDNLVLTDPKKLVIKNDHIELSDAFSNYRYTPRFKENKIKIGLWDDEIERGKLSDIDKYEVTYDGNEIQLVQVDLMPINSTSWIRERRLGDFDDKEFLYDLNGQFFLDNYTATVIKIISYLLNREKVIDSPKDFQFLYAKNRLNSDKSKKITSMVGPFQTNKSVHYILQNIYIY